MNILSPQPAVRRMGQALRRLLGRDWAAAYALMLPTALIMGGLVAYPFLRAFYISFTRTHGREIGPFIGLANYIALWEDRFFRDAVWVTIRYTVCSVALTTALALAAAVLLHRVEDRAQWLVALILLPWVMPEIVRAITWKSLLDPLYGGVNRVLLDLRLIHRSIPFFGNPRTALACVILVNVWQRIPFFVINLLAGLKAIDADLYDAAAMDGAGAWRAFLHITLPSVGPVLAVTLLLGTIWSFNEFSLILLLTSGGPMNLTRVYSVLAYSHSGRRMGMAVAATMSMSPVFAALAALLGRHLMGRKEGVALQPKRRWFDCVWRRWATHWGRSLVRLLGKFVGAITRAAAWGAGALSRWLPRRQAASVDARRRRAQRELGASFAMAALLLFELAPFYWVVITAFKTELQITRFESPLWPRPWSLDQFARLLGPGRNLVVWLQNTLLLATVTPALSTVIAAAGAYSLTRLRWHGAGVIARAVLVSYLMPIILVVMPIYHLFMLLGLLNNRIALILSYPALTLPFVTWLLMGYYTSIPCEIDDAAMMDGCSRLQAFWWIILPLSRPALAAAVIFGATQAWNEYILAYMLIVSETKWTFPMGLAQMIYGDIVPWGELSAAALLMALPVLVIYTAGQRFMTAGLTAGAVRGRG